jgi:hypothetical protein
MRDRSKIAWLAVGLFVAVPFVVVACTNGVAPAGTSDKIVDDTMDGTTAPTSSGTTGGDDASDDLPVYDVVLFDAGDPYSSYDGGPAAFCQSCACPSATQFCFGGGAGNETLGTCTNATAEAGSLLTGCDPYPTACAANPTCDCLISMLVGGDYPCYPVCANYNGYLVLYCPNP